MYILCVCITNILGIFCILCCVPWHTAYIFPMWKCLYCMRMNVYVCMYVYCLLRECPPYQVKFLECVHTWPIKLILILI